MKMTGRIENVIVGMNVRLVVVVVVVVVQSRDVRLVSTMVRSTYSLGMFRSCVCVCVVCQKKTIRSPQFHHHEIRALQRAASDSTANTKSLVALSVNLNQLKVALLLIVGV
jgi:hypothetical protein